MLGRHPQHPGVPRGPGAPLPPRGVSCAGSWGRPELAQSPMGAWHLHRGHCGVAQSVCCPAVGYSSQEILGEGLEGLIWVLSAQGGGTWHRTALGSEIAADTQFITAAATQGNCCRNPLAPRGERGRGITRAVGGEEGTRAPLAPARWEGRKESPRDGHPAARWVLPPCPPGVGGARCVRRRSAAAMLQGTGCGDVTCVSG